MNNRWKIVEYYIYTRTKTGGFCFEADRSIDRCTGKSKETMSYSKQS